MKINSNEYWNKRFTEDWNEYGGGEQSRYFAKILVESLPVWLKSALNKNGTTVCDWGCAQGDGTDLFSSVFYKKVLGIDFSSVAIETAKNNYPHSDFLCLDLLNENTLTEFTSDVMILSNVLEHFYNPFDVLNKIKNHVNDIIIISIPFDEVDRIDEHLFTFLKSNIPIKIDSKWTLVHNDIINCKEHSPSYWPGKQIVLVYCHERWSSKNKLMLSDITYYYGANSIFEPYVLLEKEKEILQLKNENERLSLKNNELKLENDNLKIENLIDVIIRKVKSRVKI